MELGISISISFLWAILSKSKKVNNYVIKLKVGTSTQTYY